ncbi:MAG: hypothetical protein O3B75_08465, partial [Planctomycetota bacterium]|nr:hypothetical protein [Planctomycetota bacterium]
DNAVGSTLTSTGGGDITFNDTIDANIAGLETLTVDAADGLVFFLGEVGGGAALATLTVTSADLTTHFFADVTTVGDQIYNGGVSIDADMTFTATDTLGDITFNGAIRSGTGVEDMTVLAGGNVTFNDTVGGADATTQLGTFEVDYGGDIGKTITFGTAAATVRAVAVKLNTINLLATPATVATIVASSDITFFNTTFAMGKNEKLTSLGVNGIRINGLASLISNATSVTLGDVNAVGNLHVTSPSIILLARSAGLILTNTGGTTNDPMVDYVVGGRVFFSVAPVMVGSGTRATFSNPTGNVDALGTLSGFANTIYRTPITVALLTGLGGQILDLGVISSLSIVNPANLVPVPMPNLPSILDLGNGDSSEDETQKKKSKSTEPNSVASESLSEAPGIPVASR